MQGLNEVRMYLPISVGGVVRQQKWQLMMMQELP